MSPASGDYAQNASGLRPSYSEARMKLSSPNLISILVSGENPDGTPYSVRVEDEGLLAEIRRTNELLEKILAQLRLPEPKKG